MFKFLKQKNTLYCFTPEVMLGTFFIEIVLALYTFIKYRTTVFGRISFLILMFLAIFQFSEYQICEGFNILFWAKIGIIAITLLPVLGLHLVLLVCKRSNVHIGIAYGIGLAGILYATYSGALSSATCSGNYVIFNSGDFIAALYALYYFGFLFWGIFVAYKDMKSLNRKSLGYKTQYWIVMGYAVFIVPTALFYIFSSLVRGSVASIMCGFALLFAFILTFRVLHLYKKKELSE